MRLATLRLRDRVEPAAVIADKAYALRDMAALARMPLPVAAPLETAVLLGSEASLRVVRDIVDAGHDLVDRGALVGYDVEALGPPVPRPGKVICVGRNFAAHARELGNEVPERPILFAKFANAVVGPFDDIVRPREVDDLDYEAELCVVIGAGGRRVQRDHALDIVAGYCCANDVSARTAQLKQGDQWLRGKGFDTFCPLGPWVVTGDEVPDPQALRISCRVDGETRQDGTTADMIFDVATIVTYCSDVFTLLPGDLILTGTPPGVAMGMTPPRWLQPGQLVEVEISGVGRIANRVVDETR